MKLSLPQDYLPEDYLRILKDATKSGQPYYNEDEANRAKRLLNTLHSPSCPNGSLFIPSGGYSVSTLRSRYFQGVQYLMDKLDPEKVFLNLYNHTKCSRTKEGLIFSVRTRERALGSSGGVNDPLENLELSSPWRQVVENFMETASVGDKFHEVNIHLNPADIDHINRRLANAVMMVNGAIVPMFVYNISENQILIIHDDPQTNLNKQ